MAELSPNVDVIESLVAEASEGRYATVLLIRYGSDEAYTGWIDAIIPRLSEVGARIVWAANEAVPLIGARDRRWDAIVIVEYPSLRAFLDMVQREGWPEVDRRRVDAMEANEVYGCTPVIDALDHR